MANEIVWYHSDETGAPVMNNGAGSLDAVLYACLVTGFNPQNLTNVAVSGGVATATKAGHGYTTDMMVDHAGAAPTGVSGRKRITVTGSGTYTFDATGAADNAAIAGVTTKRSPLGWTRPLNSGNVSIYARTDPSASSVVLRVDDSGAGVASAIAARAVAVESYTGLDAYTGLAPTAAQIAGGLLWYKGFNTAAQKPWVLIGDSKRFYLFTEGANSVFSTYGALFPHGFGDLNSYRAGDAYPAFVCGSESADSASYAFRAREAGNAPSAAGGFYISRPMTQIGSAPLAASIAPAAANTLFGAGGPLYPSPTDNGLVAVGPVLVSETNASFVHPIRGELPGVTVPLAKGFGRVMHRTILPNVTGTTRKLLVVALNSSSTGNEGAALMDTTGPW